MLVNGEQVKCTLKVSCTQIIFAYIVNVGMMYLQTLMFVKSL